MEVPSRHRPLLLLAAVIVAQLLLLAFQVKRGNDVPLIRVWSAELLTPSQKAASVVISKIGGFWYGYLDLRNARADNRKLSQEVGELRLKNEQLQGQAAEALRLTKMLGFWQENADVPMLAAQVIGANADSNSQTVFINRGERDGIRRNMAVITPDGVVGKISEALPHTAQVLLVTDRDSGLGALLAGTRTHGVVKGTGDPFLSLDYVNGEEKVPDGAEVLTSGEDRIFPKNLPVGIVEWTKPGTPFQTIQLRPAAHLDRLEEVLVVLSDQPFKLRESEATSSQDKAPAVKEEKNAFAASAIKLAPSAPKSTPQASSKPATAAAAQKNPPVAPPKKPSTVPPGGISQ